MRISHTLLLGVAALLLIGATSADSIKWTTPASAIGGITDSVVDGTAVYTISKLNHSVSKLSLETGQVVWTQALPIDAAANPVAFIVDGGPALVVYYNNGSLGSLVRSDGHMFGVCRETGNIRWATSVKPQLNTDVPQVSAIPKSGVVLAAWQQCFIDTFDPQYSALPEVQAVNASNGALLWNQVANATTVGFSFQNVESISQVVSTNGNMVMVQLTTLVSPTQYTLVNVLDSSSGDSLLLLNSTVDHWSTLVDGNVASLAATPSTYQDYGYILTMYSTTVSPQALWSQKMFFVHPGHYINYGKKAALIMTNGVLFVGWNNWLAAVDVTTGSVRWNATLSHTTNLMQEAHYSLNNNTVVLVFGGYRSTMVSSSVATPRFVAFNTQTGTQLWALNAVPTNPDYQLVFVATGTTTMVMVPNMVGWTRWALVSKTIKPSLQFNTLSMLSGVLAIVSTPNSTEYVVIAKGSVARYSP